MIQTYRGIRFVPIITENEMPVFGDGKCCIEAHLDDGPCNKVIATSPDWDRTESEDDGEDFRAWTFFDGTEDYYQPTGMMGGRPVSQLGDTTLNIFTYTPESFMVDEEPWVDDHTADDDGLHFWMFNERGDSTPGYTHGGWTIDYEEGIKDCIREYDGVCYTWLPEDFEPAPEPAVTPPPTITDGSMPTEPIDWSVETTIRYKGCTINLCIDSKQGDFTEAVRALVSTVKDIYKGVSLW